MRYFDTSFLVPLILPEATSESVAALVEESFITVLPNRDDFDQARDWLGRFETGLWAGDALHLAIAGNRGATAIHNAWLRRGEHWVCRQAPQSTPRVMAIDSFDKRPALRTARL